MSATPYSSHALRRGALQYLSGKLASGLITFVALLWLVRLLPVSDYGAYVALLASTELGYAIAGLGLQWLSARFLPEYRLKASGRALVRLCGRLLLLQGAALLVLGLGALALGGYYLSWAGMAAHRDAAALFVLVLLFEGLGRFLREPIKGSIMLQGEARLGLVTRQALFLALLGVATLYGAATLWLVALIEVAVSATALLLGLYLLNQRLLALRDKPAEEGWVEPPFSAHIAVSARMYLAHMVALTYSPQIMINVVMRVLGPEATAVFGFLRTLNDQISRYLPATLLFSLIRPKLMATYVGGGGGAELARNANLAGKLSLFVLLALVAISGLAGEGLVAVLSGGKFPDSGMLLFGFLLGLIPFSQRQLLESVAVALGRSGTCALASSTGLLIMPLLWILAELGLGLWAPIISIAAGHVLFNVVVVYAIRVSDSYRADWLGASKALLSAALALAACQFIPWGSLHVSMKSLEMVSLQTLIVGTTYLIVAGVIRPFSPDERARINRFAKRKVFVW